MKQALLYFLSFVLIQLLASLGVSALAAAVPFGDTRAVLLITTILANAAVILVFFALRWVPLSPAFFVKANVPLAALTAALAFGMLLPSLVVENLIPEAMREDILADVFKLLLSSPWGYVAIALLAPVAEELVFRGAVLRAATAFFSCRLANARRAAWAAIIFSAALFSAVHGNPAQMPHAFLIGILLAWLTHHTGSIVPAVIVHWINNSSAFILYWLIPDSYDMTPDQLFGGCNAAFFAALGASLLLFLASLLAISRTKPTNSPYAQ